MRPPRARWFEFNDHPSTPRFLREGETDALRGLEAFAGVPPVVRVVLERVLGQLDTDDVVDLCSGGTGPLLHALPETANAVTCTDLFPSERAERLVQRHRPGASYRRDSVDATRVPSDLPGLRTVINALHHFDDDLAHAVLDDAARAGQPILVVELLQRRWTDLGLMFLVPLGVVLTLPFSRPSLSAVLATYVVPVLPLMVGFDGVVSCLRARTEAELLALTDGLSQHAWTAGTERARMVEVTWMLGVPRVD